MSGDQLRQRWRSFVGLIIAGAMLVWGSFLNPGAIDWLSGIYATYWVLCVIASLSSIALVLQETLAMGRQMRLEHIRQIRQAHREFGLGRDPISEGQRSEA